MLVCGIFLMSSDLVTMLIGSQSGVSQVRETRRVGRLYYKGG